MPTRKNQTSISINRELRDKILSCKSEEETSDDLLEDMYDKACRWQEEHSNG